LSQKYSKFGCRKPFLLLISISSLVLIFCYFYHNRVHELPRVDLFVTTADPVLEPPIITLNTVLSLLALDYPANKLACYVSDDGCSVFTFYGLLEASKFAKVWVPFCKKYDIQVRAPFRYFSQVTKSDDLTEFKQEWLKMKVSKIILHFSYWYMLWDKYPSLYYSFQCEPMMVRLFEFFVGYVWQS